MFRNTQFPETTHEVDFCVVGGGMAGLLAALAAARHGAKVALMHDRPVLGGNASSEIRMHICGADRHNGIPNMRETGILEEIRLEGTYRNPHQNYSIHDLILYEKAQFEPNLTLLLNCSCQDAQVQEDHIVSVTGWQLTTETYHTVEAKIFADCSGDGILGPLTGADFRIGREARDEFGESIAPETADKKTMGMTCLFQARETDSPQPFEAPPWIRKFESCDEIPNGAKGHSRGDWWGMGYWWIELGGEYDSIHDTEHLRDELLKITLGVWDHIKNSGHHPQSENWTLEWLQFLPGKRESRRFMGDHVLNQNDVEAEGRFDDIVAHGGWSMDDHHPAGFESARIGAPPTIFHPAPSPYGIPYRSLYSRNIDNLMFAGRNISATHAAMSSTRVMGTCAAMGQAVGTAAAMAVDKGILPRGVGAHMAELQQTLQEDDMYLPFRKERLGPLTEEATLSASQGDPEPVRDGWARPIGDDTHAWEASAGDWIAMEFDGPREVAELALQVDSALDKDIALSLHYKDFGTDRVPEVAPRKMRIEGLEGEGWTTLAQIENNYQRHVRVPLGQQLRGVRLTIEETWGAERTRVYGMAVR